MTTPTDPAHLLRQAKSELALDSGARERLQREFTQRLDALAIGTGAGSSASLTHAGKTLSLGKLSVTLIAVAAAGAGWIAFDARTAAPAHDARGIRQGTETGLATPSVPESHQAPGVSEQSDRMPSGVVPSAQSVPPTPPPVAIPPAVGITTDAHRQMRAADTAKTPAPHAHSRGTSDERRIPVASTPRTAPSTSAAESAATSRSTTQSPVSNTSAQPPPPDLLAAELRLIQSASRALAAGRPRDALEALARHETLYGSGGLAEERDGLTALAQCAAGDVSAARSSASRFLRRYPTAALAERVRSAVHCAHD
jgi:hypothetical protein